MRLPPDAESVPIAEIGREPPLTVHDKLSILGSLIKARDIGNVLAKEQVCRHEKAAGSKNTFELLQVEQRFGRVSIKEGEVVRTLQAGQNRSPPAFEHLRATRHLLGCDLLARQLRMVAVVLHSFDEGAV